MTLKYIDALRNFQRPVYFTERQAEFDVQFPLIKEGLGSAAKVSVNCKCIRFI